MCCYFFFFLQHLSSFLLFSLIFLCPQFPLKITFLYPLCFICHLYFFLPFNAGLISLSSFFSAQLWDFLYVGFHCWLLHLGNFVTGNFTLVPAQNLEETQHKGLDPLDPHLDSLPCRPNKKEKTYRKQLLPLAGKSISQSWQKFLKVCQRYQVNWKLSQTEVPLCQMPGFSIDT